MMPTKPIYIVIGLSAYMIALANDILLNWNTYWTSFAGSYGLELDNDLANDILTAMLAVMTLSRAICIPISNFFSPFIIIFCSFSFLIVSHILFVIFIAKSKVIIWIASVLLGLGLGPMYASIYQMVESITPVTNIMGSLFIFYIGLFQCISSVIIGKYINSMVFIYINLFCVIVALILFLIIYFITKKYIIITNTDDMNVNVRL